MRWRVGAVLCLFAAYFGIGCRQPITPNIDRNQAPETWITAAPFDTITLKDSNGYPIETPRPGTIPVRFHVHWAGSDQDGAVTGFYWAVVETLPRVPEGAFELPRLPGPKPQDYRFTTRTDSFFIFTVAEDIPDRQHAFFIYAVDNAGKPDPTPARFIFNAQDRFPPIPIFDECHCTGTVYELQADGSVQGHEERRNISDIDNFRTLPRDTCASGSTFFFRWHALLQVPQTTVVGYRYKLDEVRFNEVGPEVTSVAYHTKVGADTIPPSVGTKLFVLRAVDQAFGTRDSTRRFQHNYSPDSWFSGPDLSSSALTTAPTGERYILQGNLAGNGVRPSLLSPDSTLILPAVRTERRTFFEVWKDTVFARAEGDTVHMNSWVILHGGGFDKDSKYRVNVSPLAESLASFPGGIVLKPAGANGSAAGFRSQVVMALTPRGFPSITGVSNLYPLFDPNNALDLSRIGGYHPMIQAGRAFAVMYAVDGDGSQDRRIPDPRELVLKIENGTATPEEQLLRNKVVTFHVNRPPYIVPDNPSIRPSLATVDTFTSINWDLNLIGADADPFLPGKTPGGPSDVVTLRYRFAVHGTDIEGNEAVYIDPQRYLNPAFPMLIQIPNGFATGPCILEVELCDCDNCEDFAGTGRCQIIRIPVYYQRTSPTSMDLSRPGSREDASIGAR